MTSYLEGALSYTDTDGVVYEFNPCETHGIQPRVWIGKSTQWGRQVLVQCPLCVGACIPRHGMDDELTKRSAMQVARDDWNTDNPLT